ncbi:hypothetical protein EGT09_04270 [Pseudomonas putida]|nr:hypothetical protein EGT09_04270 [Pseudomonas putida]
MFICGSRRWWWGRGCGAVHRGQARSYGYCAVLRTCAEPVGADLPAMAAQRPQPPTGCYLPLSEMHASTGPDPLQPRWH